MRYHDDELKAMIANGTMMSQIWNATYPDQRKRVASKENLCPELIGLEGYRVEATQYGERVRFQVGKSTGWKPCHIALHNRRSIGGDLIRKGSLSNVRIIRKVR